MRVKVRGSAALLAVSLMARVPSCYRCGGLGTRQLGDSSPEGRTTSSQARASKQVPSVVLHLKMLLRAKWSTFKNKLHLRDAKPGGSNFQRDLCT